MNNVKFKWGILLAALPLVAGAFRPPAVPLVSCDPFFSVWSAADKLTDAETTHWAGAKQPISVTLEADGKTWRLCGLEPQSVPALPQTAVTVRATQSIYNFKQDALEVELVFSTAKTPDDLEVFSRPVTYVTARVKGAKSWKLNAAISSALATNDDRAEMTTNRCEVAGLPAMNLGRKVQKPLAWSGDRVRCDWGWAWLVGPAKAGENEAFFLLAYDDVKSIQFFGEDLPAWWHRDGLSFTSMLAKAVTERPALLAKLDAFDREFGADLEKVGGAKYATLANLAYRQTFAGCKLVADRNHQPLYFSKENGSNGCIGTVDVLYPQSPQMLLMSPTLFRAMLAPVLVYASHPRWPWPFAPHDLGRFPLANQQRYAGGEKGKDERSLMPVEECGNMIIALGALAEVEGNADFAAGWWPTITKWAQYLEKFGFDPGNQLCTDDFAGHLAHNANLAAKSIVALACYGRMAGKLGDQEAAAKYTQLAKALVGKWMEAAKGGLHGSYRLAYDRPDSWAMKYNLVWDRILGLDLFPQSVYEAEMSAYKQLLKPFGLPLDNRRNWTKADWTIWCATFTGRRDDFEKLVNGVYRFCDESPSRVAFSDWYWTDSGKYQHFVARSVIGGVFLPMLTDKAVWKKYASRDRATTRLYAPLKAANAKSATFNLASFNIRTPCDKGEIAWSNRLARVVKVIKDRGFDIMGVQEAVEGQRNDLDAALPGWARVGVGRNQEGRGEATCIYYRKDRFECLGTDTFWLSETPRVPGSMSWNTACTRVCTWGRFRDKLTGNTFRYFNTHLDHISAEARVEGMKVILKEMQRVAQGETVFLTGDLNDTFERIPAEKQRAILKGCGPQLSRDVGFEHPIFAATLALYDTFLGSEKPHEGPNQTFHGYSPTNHCRIDYVFATGNVRVLRHVTCNDRPEGKFPSDHDAVMVQVEIK